MAILPQLLAPKNYHPCTWDLRSDARGREYWVDLFSKHFSLVEKLVAEEFPDVTPGQIAAMRADYVGLLQHFQNEPERFDRADVMKLTELRRDVLLQYGFDDPFRKLKRRENAAAQRLLPAVLSEIFALDPAQQLDALMAGLMAGNIFDLGALPAIERYQAGDSEFVRARASLRPRPWFIDDVARWAEAWVGKGGFNSVLFFLDNAGSDFCLGCLPLTRWMLERGARVTLAANSGPALNDITFAELMWMKPKLSALDATIGAAWTDGRLRVVETGASLPLLDLADLSPTCAAAASDADLIILHGMGRAIESNFDVPLSCAALRTAIIKDPAVAEHLGGVLFDCVCKFTTPDRCGISCPARPG